jgi:hypothetical protein
MLLTASLLFAFVLADDPGLRARAGADAYPRHAASSENLVAIGAEMLSAQEVRNTFATELNRGFYVIEVGVFPADGKSWNLNPDDFALRIGSDKMVRPATPSTIAGILQRKAKDQTARRAGSPNDITVYPSATIGYESASAGTLGPDGRPMRRGGWVTGGGVGVGMGGGPSMGGPMPPAPGASDVDRSTMQSELWDKSLPQGEIRRPVAGYLYFPMPADQKKPGSAAGKAFELVMHSQDAKIRVALANPTK